MKARFVGPEAELGPVHALDFFGNTLTREWSDVTFTADALEKAKGNKYIEIKGEKTAPAVTADPIVSAVTAAETDETIRARLAELGVEVPANSSPAKLRSLLEKAEEANAKAEAEAEAAAEKLVGEDTSSAT